MSTGLLSFTHMLSVSTGLPCFTGTLLLFYRVATNAARALEAKGNVKSLNDSLGLEVENIKSRGSVKFVYMLTTDSKVPPPPIWKDFFSSVTTAFLG